LIDRILKNGQFYTPGEGFVGALALRGEYIVAAGTEDAILPLANAGTQIDDLGGRFAMPGFVDAHLHWEATAKARHAVNLYGARSKAEALERIAAQVAVVRPGEWLYGTGWQQSDWEDSGGAFPTNADLDTVTGEIPTFLKAKSGHAAWVNSAALRLANLDERTPDPAGGRVGRGEEAGILFETPAMILVSNHMPSISQDQLADWMADLQSEAWRAGLTGFHDFDDPSCLDALGRLRARGALGLRVLKQINDPFIEHAYALGLHSSFGDDWLRLGALKIFADGALGPLTAAMIAPYENDPQNYGVVVTEKETMVDLVSKASKLGFASSIHAIGDRAVHDVLDVFEIVRKEEAARGVPREAYRHRIEHVQIIHPEDMPRLGELDIIASMQPIHMASDWPMADRYWGERARTSYHWRGQLENGARLAFGSDSPIDTFDPFQGLYAAVARKDPQHQPENGWYLEARLSMEEALAAYTLGSAWASGMEDRAGRLGAGYLADLVVLSDNPLTVPPEALLEMQVLGTMVGGAWRHRIFG
jgi:predicted amidohydrolase YtcJ